MIRSRFAPACIVTAALGSACVAACSSSSASPFPGDNLAGDDASTGSGSSGSSNGVSGSNGASSGGASSGGASSGSQSSGSSSGGSGGGSSSSSGGSGSSGGAKDASSTADTGAGGSSSGLVTDADAGACPAPSGITTNQTTALQILNTTRAAMGSPCINDVASLNTSATNHCAYYAANVNATGTCNSKSNPHSETQGCSMYVSSNFGTREQTAGYNCQPSATQNCMASEVMAFDDNPTTAIAQWIGSIYHRSPLLDPRMRDFGYGNATGCDTIDLGEGLGSTTPDSVIVSYPYDGQTGVGLSFQGNQEVPTPPVPPAGWPSAYPITVFMAATSVTLTTDEFGVDGGAQLAHQVMTPQSSGGYLTDALVLYGNVALTTKTTYRVHVAGTRTKKTTTTPFDVTFAFTTQ